MADGLIIEGDLWPLASRLFLLIAFDPCFDLFDGDFPWASSLHKFSMEMDSMLIKAVIFVAEGEMEGCEGFFLSFGRLVKVL